MQTLHYRRIAAIALTLMSLSVVQTHAELLVTHTSTYYESPGTVTITCTLTWNAEDPLLSLQIRPFFPAGWQFSHIHTDTTAEWLNDGMIPTGNWSNGMLHVTYDVLVPALQTGVHHVHHKVEYHLLSMPNPITQMIQPDPLEVLSPPPPPTELQVYLHPAADTAEARWSFTGSPYWYPSGSIISVEPGTVSLSFSETENWTAPPPISITISNEMRVVCGVTYVPGDMVRIPAGEFYMGQQEGVGGRHVMLDEFYIDRSEVTVGHYTTFAEATVRPLPDQPAHDGGVHAPVTRVTWQDAAAYAAWMNKELPTEAQWEYAARGGLASSRYPHGDTLSHYDANYGMIIGRAIEPGHYSPNAYGLFDMAGNVWEWCADWYAELPSDPATNPGGPVTGERKIIRGGSYASSSLTLENALRYAVDPGVRYHDLGFRCVVPTPLVHIEYQSSTSPLAK